MVEQLQDGQPIVVPSGTKDPQGYISTSYFGNESAKIQNEIAQQGQDDQTINELSQKLGLDPTALGQGDVPPAGTTDAEKAEFLKRLSSEDGQRFKKEFKDYVGLDIEEAFSAVNDAARLTRELDEWRRGVVRQQEETQLRQELGKDFETIMPEVVNYFQQLPPHQQRALDNLDGARLIAALIRQQKASELRGGSAPQYVNGNVRQIAGKASAPYIRMSDMVQWDGKTLDARMGGVMRAKQQGTFIYDM